MIEAPAFLVPDLRAIDTASAEVIACTVFSDERPFRGVAGLLDWRLAGRLSALAKSGFLTGERGEVLLVPGRGKLPFDKLVVLGLGPRAGFDADVAQKALERLRTTLDGLSVKRAVVELPGRGSGELDPDRAAELLERSGHADEQIWTLVDTADAETTMQKRLARRHDARPRPDA